LQCQFRKFLRKSIVKERIFREPLTKHMSTSGSRTCRNPYTSKVSATGSTAGLAP